MRRLAGVQLKVDAVWDLPPLPSFFACQVFHEVAARQSTVKP
jgi:hypothetical protein